MSDETEREHTIAHLKMDQVALAALTIVGRADTINKGRVELSEFIISLNDEECAHLLFALTEMLAMKLMQTCDSKEQWFAALERSGELIAIAIAGLEAEGQ